ncbi:hypothetical protein C2E23DRAFT_834661 [Lenzites betulinus]|nr:hypothetical protein C2E23DRAFT_834661 [Lenzites betulinus]
MLFAPRLSKDARQPARARAPARNLWAASTFTRATAVATGAPAPSTAMSSSSQAVTSHYFFATRRPLTRSSVARRDAYEGGAMRAPGGWAQVHICAGVDTELEEGKTSRPVGKQRADISGSEYVTRCWRRQRTRTCNSRRHAELAVAFGDATSPVLASAHSNPNPPPITRILAFLSLIPRDAAAWRQPGLPLRGGCTGNVTESTREAVSCSRDASGSGRKEGKGYGEWDGDGCRGVPGGRKSGWPEGKKKKEEEKTGGVGGGVRKQGSRLMGCAGRGGRHGGLFRD